jgi:hypothetical protein
MQMKKIVLLLCGVFLVSCSNDQTESETLASNSSEPVLENGMLKFKDDESFITEYRTVSKMKDNEEIQNWVSNKGLKSLLNVSNDSIEMQEDIISNERIIYSEALKAILNLDSKFKIGNTSLWLNERNFYILPDEDLNKKPEELISLKKDLKVYGELLNYSGENLTNKSSLTGRDVPIPNENKTKTFIVEIERNKSRFVLDLYNETILLHSSTISSSEMKLRGTLQYRSCSFWSCSWKTDTTNFWQFSNVNLTSSVGNYNSYPWKFSIIDTNVNRRNQSYALLATHGYLPPFDRNVRVNFQVTGTVTFKLVSSPVLYPINISWY